MATCMHKSATQEFKAACIATRELNATHTRRPPHVVADVENRPLPLLEVLTRVHPVTKQPPPRPGCPTSPTAQPLSHVPTKEPTSNHPPTLIRTHERAQVHLALRVQSAQSNPVLLVRVTGVEVEHLVLGPPRVMAHTHRGTCYGRPQAGWAQMQGMRAYVVVERGAC